MTKLYIAILLIISALVINLISYQVRVADFNIEKIQQSIEEVEVEVEVGAEIEVIEKKPEPELEIRNLPLGPELPRAEDSRDEVGIEGELEINLDVPFTSQAPFAKWDKLHNDACEEAAVVMVHYFLQGLELTPVKADEEIIKLVNWQVANWGGHHHLPVEEVAELLKYYGYQNVEISYDITVEDIKRELRQKNPVIIPTAGRKLGNPYYKQPGPLYHMLVIRGFEQNKFITNDPGTRRGENFGYKQDVLFGAIHDLPQAGGEEILTGRRAMIVVRVDKK